MGRSLTGGWSDQLELATATLETVHALLRVQLRAAGVKKKVKPLIIKRPRRLSKSRKTRAENKRSATIEEIQQMLTNIDPGKGN